MEKLVIVGTGDYSSTISFYLKKRYDILCYFEEKEFRKNKIFMSKPNYCLEEIEKKFDTKHVKVFVAIGPNKKSETRTRVYKNLKLKGYEFINYIHSSAIVWDNKSVGENTFIFPNVVIEPYACVGNNCVLWSGVIIAHHTKVNDNVFIAPGANISGRVIISNNVFIGINATIRDNIFIAEGCVIGGGATVKKNTDKNKVFSQKQSDELDKRSEDVKV
jgi:sugar O-acyltransferase (sialic acid O-acetyltransferase NeuD family)